MMTEEARLERQLRDRQRSRAHNIERDQHLKLLEHCRSQHINCLGFLYQLAEASEPSFETAIAAVFGSLIRSTVCSGYAVTLSLLFRTD